LSPFSDGTETDFCAMASFESTFQNDMCYIY